MFGGYGDDDGDDNSGLPADVRRDVEAMLSREGHSMPGGGRRNVGGRSPRDDSRDRGFRGGGRSPRDDSRDRFRRDRRSPPRRHSPPRGGGRQYSPPRGRGIRDDSPPRGRRQDDSSGSPAPRRKRDASVNSVSSAGTASTGASRSGSESPPPPPPKPRTPPQLRNLKPGELLEGMNDKVKHELRHVLQAQDMPEGERPPMSQELRKALVKVQQKAGINPYARRRNEEEDEWSWPMYLGISVCVMFFFFMFAYIWYQETFVLSKEANRKPDFVKREWEQDQWYRSTDDSEQFIDRDIETDLVLSEIIEPEL